MKFCPDCGFEVPTGAKFCPGCGLRIEAPGAGADAPATGDQGPQVSDSVINRSTISSESTDASARAGSINIHMNQQGAGTQAAAGRCPLCGFREKEDSFQCRECHRTGICPDHYVAESRCCDECANRSAMTGRGQTVESAPTPASASTAGSQPAASASVQAPDGPPRDTKSGDVWLSPIDGKDMVFVPAGEFLMGTSDRDIDPHEDEDDYEDETPQRRVHVDAFWLDKTPVTVREYRRFCEEAGRDMPRPPRWGWQENHPIVNVTCHDAEAYARWAGKRLPTEAEWEKAARGTDGRMYPWGFESPGAGGRWRCNLDGEEDGFEYTSPVGSFPMGASPYGCLDMAGNVEEWCADWYDETYYRRAPNRNPKGASSGEYRVLRGGSWYRGDPRYFRCADRDYDHPDTRINYDSFRCARGPE